MQSFLWYDYETFGISPKYSRPAQFGGLRTDMNLELIGEPVTVLYCSPSDDFLPKRAWSSYDYRDHPTRGSRKRC